MRKVRRNESRQIARCESVIENGLRTFIQVGQAFSEIKTAKLYTLSHKTFEDYCRDKWGMSRMHAQRLMAISGVIGSTEPATERQGQILTAPQSSSQFDMVAQINDHERRLQILEKGHSQMVTIREYAKLRCHHRSAVDRWIMAGMPHKKMGPGKTCRILIDPVVADKWLEERTEIGRVKVSVVE